VELLLHLAQQLTSLPSNAAAIHAFTARALASCRQSTDMAEHVSPRIACASRGFNCPRCKPRIIRLQISTAIALRDGCGAARNAAFAVRTDNIA